ncbi:MAG TPA: hypothetical protein VLZ12_06545 [Verrucomicrobiae bacterium]|nr:hypothetical protein [Verrucomicrobiae bacterium]
MTMSRSDGSRGSVLLSAAVCASVLAIVIAGVLAYLSNEYNLNNRTHSWNQAFHLAESAAEIGIAEYNYQYSLGGSGVGFQSANGWSGGSGTYAKTISNLTDTSGKSVGTMKVTATGVGTPSPQFRGEGTVTSSNYGGQSLSRAVSISLASNSSLFPYGLVSKTSISLANVFTIDSYDSSDPAKSTNGQYDSSKKQANGNIATLATGSSAVSLANSADIYGTISTGPGGSLTMVNSPKVGPTFSGQATTPAQAEANGWLTHAFTSPPPDITVPTALTAASNLGTINLTGVGTMTIGGGDYRVNSLSAANSSIITVSGNVRLYVLGNVSVLNSAKIDLPAGSSLTVYVGGSTVNISGAGVVNTAAGSRSINNQWFGLSTMNNGTIANAGVFNGTFYAPSAKVTVANSAVISGSLVASNTLFSNAGGIHYDESLKGSGGGAGTTYNVIAWQELRYVGGAWVP